MQIRQFEKLQGLVKDAVDQILRIKLENKNLHKQINELRARLDNNTNINDENLSAEIERLNLENKQLREKQQVISSRLRKVLAKVKNLSEGVES